MITVNRHVGGSYVVVTFDVDPWSPYEVGYIDARKDVRYPNHSFIEYVRGGRVRHYEKVPNFTAPERIMEMVRNLQKGLTP